MDMHIKGIGLPKAIDEMIELAIFGNGDVLITGESWRNPEDGKCYYGLSNDKNVYKAIEVPEPHGDLIDRDKLRAKEFIHDGDAYAVVMSRDVAHAPTIIPASQEEEHGVVN